MEKQDNLSCLALADIHESIAELKVYKKLLLIFSARASRSVMEPGWGGRNEKARRPSCLVLADIQESIAELKIYKKLLLILSARASCSVMKPRWGGRNGKARHPLLLCPGRYSRTHRRTEDL